MDNEIDSSIFPQQSMFKNDNKLNASAKIVKENSL